MPSAFWIALWAGAQALGADPRDLANVLWAESGIDPSAQNGKCVGLNQFCPGTFETAVHGMTPEAYRALPAEEQLPFVLSFWQTKPAKAMGSARDLYWANFVPATFKAGAPDSFDILAPLPANQRIAIARDNPRLSRGKATILAGDLRAYLDQRASEPGFQAVLAQIDAHAPGEV